MIKWNINKILQKKLFRPWSIFWNSVANEKEIWKTLRFFLRRYILHQYLQNLNFPLLVMIISCSYFLQIDSPSNHI